MFGPIIIVIAVCAIIGTFMLIAHSFLLESERSTEEPKAEPERPAASPRVENEPAKPGRAILAH